MPKFELVAPYKPAGDQPKAISELSNGISREKKQYQTLLGVTGSGKTYSIANVIQNLQLPTLVLAHNKTLAAQLCSEFKEFFPNNAVEYFVSYYDYYQPEAYIPSRDVYIEKEADINQEIERLRHSATRSLICRNDVIIVASVSCIYGLGIPEDYCRGVIKLKMGDNYNRTQLLYDLEKIQYTRNDTELRQGRYRVKGETIDIFPSWEENLIRLEFFGDELDAILVIDPVDSRHLSQKESFDIFPATHYVLHDDKTEAFTRIRTELKDQVKNLEKNGKELEAHRLQSRTNYDLELLEEIGHCKGIENYSRHLSGRDPGTPGGVLLDFFPKEFLMVIDESHVTVPQVRGMYNGDQSRKQTLVDYGFRLPSAKDNRPLTFNEFSDKIHHCIFVSATPGPYELDMSHHKLTEQVIRPTGLLDPIITIKPTKDQIQDLEASIKAVIQKGQRALVTTLTKKLAEDLTSYFETHDIKVQYLHSDITALDRIDILHDLRLGTYDVVVGVNLLREGLDLPEVSLVAILDADKEGFLRNERSLIQTIGRAARHEEGAVILYADKVTHSMKQAIDETTRRRNIQLAHNKKHNITPKTISKKITDIREESRELIKELEAKEVNITAKSLPKLIAKLEKEMHTAAKNLEFELAAVLRDKLEALKTTRSN